MLLNLLSNAIKFTSKGHVTVAVAPVSRHENDITLRFDVTDTGMGMSDDVMKNLFQEYAQADASTSRTHGGTGLGLSICKQIIHLMQGEIHVESTIGEGSTFWFQIPAGIIDGSRFHAVEQKDNLPEIEPLTILLVEDDKTIAKYTATLLQAQHHHVYIAESGEEAIDAAQKRFYDIVLMDYNLPDMKGSDITRALLKLDLFPQTTPVIGLTANTDPVIIDACHAAGMIDYLVKPVDKASLIRLLAQYGKPRNALTHQHIAEITVNSRIDAMINDFGMEYTKEIVTEFIEGMDVKIGELDMALAQTDSVTCIRNTHDIASMSGTLGMERSAALFKDIEKRLMQDQDVVSLYQDARNVYISERQAISDFLSPA